MKLVSFRAQSFAHARSAVRYLDSAIANLDASLKIVENSVPTEQSMRWLADFDYDRFFREKIVSGGMPNRPDLWGKVASEVSRGQILPSAMDLRNKLASIRDTVKEILAETDFADTLSLVRRCASDVAEASALGLMIGVFNDVKPLEPRWSKSFNRNTLDVSSEMMKSEGRLS